MSKGGLEGKVAIAVGAGQQPGETLGNGRATAQTGVWLPVDGGLLAKAG